MLCDVAVYSKWWILSSEENSYYHSVHSEHCVGTLWFGTQLAPHQEWCPQPVESHAALLERVERCTAVLECEGRCVRVCYHWHHRDSFHYKQVLHYGTDYITEGSTVHFCVTETTKPYGTNYCSRVHDRLWCVSVFSISLWQKNVKIPFGVDDRWPPRLSREKRRRTKRWRNRGQISLLRWKKTLKLHLTSVAITILERGGGRKESVQEMGIMLCDNYWSYRITIANLKTNLGMHSLKGTVHPKIKICWKFTHPQAIISSELMWRNWALHQKWILCNEWVPSEWVQTADKNITIIHK